jgi:hypothetical protein
VTQSAIKPTTPRPIHTDGEGDQLRSSARTGGLLVTGRRADRFKSGDGDPRGKWSFPSLDYPRPDSYPCRQIGPQARRLSHPCKRPPRGHDWLASLLAPVARPHGITDSQLVSQVTAASIRLDCE